jgi:hypothetical protein
LATLRSRIEKLEEAAGMAAKTHVLWDDGKLDLKATIAEMIAAGRAGKDDRFLTACWSKGPERPMSPDPFAPSTGPRPSPSPANDWPPF